MLACLKRVMHIKNYVRRPHMCKRHILVETGIIQKNFVEKDTVGISLTVEKFLGMTNWLRSTLLAEHFKRSYNIGPLPLRK